MFWCKQNLKVWLLPLAALHLIADSICAISVSVAWTDLWDSRTGEMTVLAASGVFLHQEVCGRRQHLLQA